MPGLLREVCENWYLVWHALIQFSLAEQLPVGYEENVSKSKNVHKHKQVTSYKLILVTSQSQSQQYFSAGWPIAEAESTSTTTTTKFNILDLILQKTSGPVRPRSCSDKIRLLRGWCCYNNNNQ